MTSLEIPAVSQLDDPITLEGAIVTKSGYSGSTGFKRRPGKPL